jgi:cell division protease FtsH
MRSRHTLWSLIAAVVLTTFAGGAPAYADTDTDAATSVVSDATADDRAGEMSNASSGRELVTYADVLDALRAGYVLEAAFDPLRNVVQVTLLDATVLESSYPVAQAPALVVSMLDSGVRISSLPAPGSSGLPFGAQPLPDQPANSELDDKTSRSFIGRYGMFVFPLMVLGFLLLLWRGKRKEAKAVAAVEAAAVPETKTTFADVAGCEEAIDDLREFVEFLKNPERFERLGAKIPRGALLIGPPGTGKTLLARAVAGESGVAFHHAAGSDFVELYVGVGAQRVRELFTKARESERAIVFIDEIDAIGRVRSTAPGTVSGGHIEQENTLIALLNELDGFSQSNVIVLAATNRADILDPALTRPGRLERKVHVPNPDRRGREHILRVHTANKPLAGDVDLERVARRTTGMSGADLAHIANEAAIEAARLDMDEITHACFDDAIATVAMGRPRYSAVITDTDRRITAWHEAGHALVALLEPNAEDPVAVSIVPRGAAGGVTWMNGSDDHYLSRHAARARLAVALAGRAGEELLLDGEFTQGAQSDLVSATQLAESMVTRFGMTRRGLQVRGRFDGSLDEVSGDMVDELLETAMEHARSILSQNLVALESLAAALLEHDTLAADEIRAAVEGRTVAPRSRVLRKPGRVGPSTAQAPVTVTGRTDRDHDKPTLRDRLRHRGLLKRLGRGKTPAKQPMA